MTRMTFVNTSISYVSEDIECLLEKCTSTEATIRRRGIGVHVKPDQVLANCPFYTNQFMRCAFN